MQFLVASRWPHNLVKALFRAMLFAAFALFLPYSAVAQASNIAHIGYVSVIRQPIAQSYLEAFVRGLNDLGYVEAKTYTLEARFANGDRDALPRLIAELISAHVDIIVASSGDTAVAAKRATSAIPIVMAASSDAVPQGIVDSLSSPGGNVTGLTMLSSELAPKRLQLLKELIPGLTRVAALFCPRAPINMIELANVQAAAATLGVEIQPISYAGTTASWQDATDTLTRNHPGALYLLDCTNLPLPEIVKFAIQQRIPTMSPYSTVPRMGGLIGYGPDTLEMSRLAATYVARILKGTKPSDLPIDLPSKFELVVNSRTAAAIGVRIPDSMMMRATEILK